MMLTFLVLISPMDSKGVLDHLLRHCPSYVEIERSANDPPRLQHLLDGVERALRPLEAVTTASLIEAAATAEECTNGPSAGEKWLDKELAGFDATYRKLDRAERHARLVDTGLELQERFLFVSRLLFVPNRKDSDGALGVFHAVALQGLAAGRKTRDAAMPFLMDSRGTVQLIGLAVPNNGNGYSAMRELTYYAGRYPRRAQWWK